MLLVLIITPHFTPEKASFVPSHVDFPERLGACHAKHTHSKQIITARNSFTCHLHFINAGQSSHDKTSKTGGDEKHAEVACSTATQGITVATTNPSTT